MTKTKRNARLALGMLLIILGLAIWSQENSSLITQGGWIRNFYFFVPGFFACAWGISYINLMVRSPHAGERSYITAISNRKDA